MIGRGSGVVLAICICFVACAPVNPSVISVAGRWKVDWTCGVESLELNANGTYSYTIDFAAGGRAIDSGSWKLVARTTQLEGAHIILENALETCSALGDRAVQHGRSDRELETVWEWGRLILSFHPDIPGFTRA